MNDPVSLPPSYFDTLYAVDPDPWRFATSDYERAKYDATIAVLPSENFSSAFEVGCSIGVLTRRLAEHCKRLLAVDVSEVALAQARARCALFRHVEIRKMRVPEAWPDGMFDLIILSEILYYLSPDDIAQLATCARHCSLPGGTILLVHYTLATESPCNGDFASEIFIEAAKLGVARQRREAQYRLDLLRA